MTLQRFRALTAGVDPRALRDAMTAALLVEAPRTAEQYARFYRRVIGALPGAPAANEATGGIVRYKDVAAAI